MGCRTIPSPPALDHQYHPRGTNEIDHQYHPNDTTNEIALFGVSPSMPTNVVEIDGVDVKVRPLEEAILYVAAEVTGSSCSSVGSSRIVNTVCKRCSSTNCHVCDCAYVLCPECHSVMPTSNVGGRQNTPHWGVGLGFSPELRALWLDQLLG